MPDVTIRTRGGADTTLPAGEAERLAAALRGEVVTADAPHYADVCRVWNGTVERRPAIVARCRGSADVVRAVRFAREHDLLLGVRGGGHNIAGNGVVDRGLLVDLAPMRGVRVDPGQRFARVDGGALLGDMDRETQTFGLATPLGINSTTGIAGLTLGGGYGWLSRAYGLTVDNLRAADVVTADGALVSASESEHPDLFWALRGGGGNFGVVTSFEYALHPVGPEVLAGLIVHPFDHADELLRRYRDVVRAAPDSLTAWVVMRKAPPLPFLPTEVHGRPVLVIAACYTGPREDAERVLRPLREIGTPIADVIDWTPYAGFQTAFDPLLTPGARNYWKTHNFATLHDPLIDVLVDQIAHLPGPMSEIFLAHLGGAVSRRADDATAYAGRHAQFVMNVHARWEDRTADDAFVAWARNVYTVAAPYAAAGGAYVNFMTADEGNRVRAAYGANYDRLASIKAKYDPSNVFRTNQNIAPAPAAQPGAYTPMGTSLPTGAYQRPT
ncbi:FAD-binding oxidoreductase [Roseisolibacter agri]|uniref:FAD-linked oxidase n=1 Tax=Roseisolibacter agri TaxID=2014610 RepID=A0AA37V498_9BACT|nr:FAD-binding oxidoreductase [Roseisolibacter agri]GLC27627.1 FAD-linked oxidase [Roseisolibacter agri]